MKGSIGTAQAPRQRLATSCA